MIYGKAPLIVLLYNNKYHNRVVWDGYRRRAPLRPSSEVVRVTSRERQWGGRLKDLRPGLFLFLRWTGWEGAAASVPASAQSSHIEREEAATCCRRRRHHRSCLCRRRTLFTAATLESKEYNFFVFIFIFPYFLFSRGFRKRELSSLERTDVLTPRGQRAASAGGLGRTAGNVIPEFRCFLCFPAAACWVSSPGELLSCRQALYKACCLSNHTKKIACAP